MDPKLALDSIRQEGNKLNERFFGVENMNRIQKLLQDRVRSSTGKVIARQNDDDLFIIMRGIFVMSSTNAYEQVDLQVSTLNEMVLAQVVPQVVYGVQAHAKYLREVGTTAVPIDRGTYVSAKGEMVAQLPVGLL